MKNIKILSIVFFILLSFIFVFNGCNSSSTPTSSSGGGGGGGLPTATATTTSTQGGGSYSGGSIIIESDADFLPEKGVVSGTGTSADPYIIEGWTIDASTFNTSNWPYIKVGIAIDNTTKYFIIRNCTITAAGNYGAGILLSTQNGKIQNCTISNCGYGIETSNCVNIEISNNIINNCDDCISNGSYRSEGIVIKGNTLTACASHGIYFHYLSDNSIATKNIITGSGTGIYASALMFGGCTISENYSVNNNDGIVLTSDSVGDTITTNIANNNIYDGIRIEGSNSVVSYNTCNYNGASGIVLDQPVGAYSGDNNYIHNNTANNNNADGFYLGYDCIYNIISNNTFLNNNQSSNYYYDMDINDNNNTLTNNTYGTIYHP